MTLRTITGGAAAALKALRRGARAGVVAAAAVLAAPTAYGQALGQQALGQDEAACADPSARCGATLSGDCLARVGAGALTATSETDACAEAFQAYRACLAEVAAICAPSVAVDPAGCDDATAEQLWTLAEDAGDCLGYKSFIDVCSTNPRAAFARAAMTRLSCEGAGAPAVIAVSPRDRFVGRWRTRDASEPFCFGGAEPAFRPSGDLCLRFERGAGPQQLVLFAAPIEGEVCGEEREVAVNFAESTATGAWGEGRFNAIVLRPMFPEPGELNQLSFDIRGACVKPDGTKAWPDFSVLATMDPVLSP